MDPTDLTFIKLGYKDKIPLEDWSKPECRYSWSQIINSRFRGTIGVVTGINGLVVLEIDDTSRCSRLGLIPERDTLTARTDRGGLHYYYHVEIDSPGSVVFYKNEGSGYVHLGELQGYGQYVVGPSSIYPDGNEYKEIFEPEIIKDVTYQSLIQPFFDDGCIITADDISRKVESGTVKLGLKTAYRAHNTGYLTAFRIEDVWDLSGFVEIAPGIYQGPHPVHGSKYGKNLYVNTNKQLWRCFRCQSGGDAYNALAVDVGIIDCKGAIKGALKGSMFGEMAQEAIRRGLIK
jgi:hypothetical protein